MTVSSLHGLIMNCIFWNCKVVASDCSSTSLLDLLHENKPLFPVLVENKTHSSSAHTILQKSRFNRIVAGEALGFSDEIWLLWYDGRIDIEVISTLSNNNSGC